MALFTAPVSLPTGEISRRGLVPSVGGIKEKVVAAASDQQTIAPESSCGNTETGSRAQSATPRYATLQGGAR